MFNTGPVTAARKTVGYLGAYLWRQHGLCPPESGAHRACGSGAHPPSHALLLTRGRARSRKGCNSGKAQLEDAKCPVFRLRLPVKVP